MDENKQIDEMAEMLEIIAKAREAYANDVTDRSENEYIREGLLDAGYRKPKEAMWKDNHCTNCGTMPMGEEIWTHLGKTPPKFGWFMDYCPTCGAKMKGE